MCAFIKTFPMEWYAPTPQHKQVLIQNRSKRHLNFSRRYKKGKFYMHQILPTHNYRMKLHQIEIMGMKSGKTLGSYAETTTQNLPLAHSQYSNQQTLQLNSWHIKGVVSYS